MKQLKEQYWPQHRVFFIGVLALFPEKLEGHEVNGLFYRPYFVADDPDFIQLELEEYRKAGYLQYEKSGALYKIVSINSQKAYDDLIQYLRLWRHDKLLSLLASKPPDARSQQSLLLDAVTQSYASNQDEPRITLSDVYGDTINLAYESTFWELILSWQLLDKQVEITYMDYARRIDGLYDDDAQPLIDFKVIGIDLADEIKRRALQTGSAAPATLPNITSAQSDAVPTKQESCVLKNRREIRIEIVGDGIYTIARLEKDGAYDRFMEYVLDEDNANIKITIGDINALKGNLETARDLTELIRRSGFTRRLKKAFFPTSKSNQIRFTPVAILDEQQIEDVKKQARKLA